MESNEVIIEICLGSSCHSKGSYGLVSIIKDFISQNSNCKLVGSLCNDNCVNGPSIKIGSQIFIDVEEGNVLEILKNNV